MFKERLLTSLVLIPLVLIFIYYANIWILSAIVLMLAVACGLEWLQLIPIQHLTSKVVFIIGLLLMLFMSSLGFNQLLIIGLVLWVFILLAVLTYPGSESVWGYRITVGAFCFILLPLFARSIAGIYQHEQGKDLIVYLLCLVWAADIGAYIVGKRWGHHKLIPRVSPGKTIEGSLGALLLVMVISMIGYLFFKPASPGIWYAIAFGTALISMLGDLFISMLKRRSKLKDTGHIIPGHGGILDRLDSLIAAAPLFYCGLLYLRY